MKKPANKEYLLIYIVLLFAILFCVPSFADEYIILKVIKEKEEKRKSVSWNLADWMTQKSEFATWDHWLALNTSPNLFDFYLDGSYKKYDREIEVTPGSSDTKEFSMKGGALGAYLTIFGVEGGWSSTDEKSELSWGTVNLRLFGKSIQSSNLTLSYGLRDWLDVSTNLHYKNSFVGGNLDLFLFWNLGISGQYYQYLEDDLQGVNTKGSFWKAGLLINLSFIQLRTYWFEEPYELTTSGGSLTTETRSGIEGALRVYF